MDKDTNSSVTLGLGSVINESTHGVDGDDDEDNGDLEKQFCIATEQVKDAVVAGKLSQASTMLELYGLYKIATEGCCRTSSPFFFQVNAFAKWNAWKKLGDLSSDDAKKKYIEIVKNQLLGFDTSMGKCDNPDAMNTKTNEPMGPVFSTCNFDELPENESEMDDVHAFSRDGDEDNLLKCVYNGVSVNTKDSESRTPLHWAVDRGHFDIVKMLVNIKSDINAQDNEGLTPLHYAAICGRETIARFLVEQNADTNVKDNDGKLACDFFEVGWPWLQSPVNKMDDNF